MRNRRLFRPLVASLALGATFAACARGPRISPVAVVESVYGFQLSSPVDGLPTPAQVSYLSRFLGDSLNKLLARAQGIQDADRKAHPDEKPSWADGSLFTSLFEGPTGFYAMTPIQGPVVKVPIHFERDDSGHRVTWTDTALVARRDTMWVVEDVLYGGTWPFAPHGGLRAQLAR